MTHWVGGYLADEDAVAESSHADLVSALVHPHAARGKACLLVRKRDHFTQTREIKRHVRALACNHPEGWKLQGNEGVGFGSQGWGEGEA